MDMLNESVWGDVKTQLLDGVPARKREITESVLETNRSLLLETASAGSVAAHDIANFRQNVMPLIRRIIPNTIATELVGTQPLKGPVGQVYSMRYKYVEAVTPAVGYESPFSGGTGAVAAGQELFGNTSSLRNFYSSSIGAAQTAGAGAIGGTVAAVSGTGATGDAWESSSNATSYGTGTMDVDGAGARSVPVGGRLLGGSGSYIEGTLGRKVTLEVVAQTVEARSRKLHAGWTVEAAQDLNKQHGLDMESELTKGMSNDIIAEIDAEIIADLAMLAGTVTTFDFSATTTGYTPTWVGDRMANVGAKINWVANEIGRKTRRAVANFIVVSPMMVSLLQTASRSAFAPAIDGSFEGPNDTKLVGKLNGSLKVYSYLWNNAQPGAATPAGDDTIIVGLKNGSGETDAGYFFCPYIPVMSTGVMVDPFTGQPRVSLMTRYGKAVFTDTTTSLGNSADYYGRVNCSNVEFL